MSLNSKVRFPSALTIAATLCCVVISSGASAQDEATSKPDYSPYYSGAFHELSVRGALNGSAGGVHSGLGGDFGWRQAFPMELGDTRISYRYDQLDTEGALELQTHGLHLGFGGHPFYMFLLRGDWLGYTIASFYGEIGFGGQYTVDENDDTDLSATWSLGAGLDLPLSDADVGAGLRLNLLYRYHAPFGSVTDSEFDLSMHTFFLGLGWRTNGLLF